MSWEKQGLLCSRETINLDWCKLNIMCPVPYLVDDNTLRIFVAFCDELNQGRVGYIDVDPSDPHDIIRVSETPVLDLGEKGMFDENGVLPTSVLIEEGGVYLYYCGFQKQVGIPYTSLCGLAVSKDNGNSFTRVKLTPVLERIDAELFVRTGAFITKQQDKYTLIYASGNQWFDHNGKLEPVYSLREISSDRKDYFCGNGKVILDLVDDEYGITIPQLFEDNSMIFSSRSRSKGYRIGHALFDGDRYVRDSKSIIPVSDKGWDSEMICFAKEYSYKNNTYLFYCGNHYGIGGLGWAKKV